MVLKKLVISLILYCIIAGSSHYAHELVMGFGKEMEPCMSNLSQINWRCPDFDSIFEWTINKEYTYWFYKTSGKLSGDVPVL